jgi:predicted amidohydrolase YtcJ
LISASKSKRMTAPGLILFNAHVITMDPSLPRAKQIEIRGGRILSVSRNETLHGLMKSNTKVIDCGGRTVIPGFIDAHCHLSAYAESLVSLNLSPGENIRSISDIQERIQTACKDRSAGGWIRGKGYNEFYLAEQRHPNRNDLDGATTDHPVKLTHRSGHAHVLNSLALKLVGITAETGDPAEGLIDRDLQAGTPTGILYGMSGHLAKTIPPVDGKEMEQGVRLASERLLSCGITSIQDATSHNDLRNWRMVAGWQEKGLFRPRVTMLLGEKGFNEYMRQPDSFHIDENRLRRGGVKIIIHEITGSLYPSQKRLNKMVLAIHRAGFQAVLHAIQPPTIEAACNAIEYALEKQSRPDHRHRIEHCSVCPPPLLERLHALGIVVVTQPAFIYYNGARYLKTVPPGDLEYLYPVGSLMRHGIRVAGSSDFPVADPDPFVGIYAAVSRMAESGETVLPEERTEPLDALRMFTTTAAEASFEEKVKGSITPGKMADLVILNGDPTATDVRSLKESEVVMTILNGEIAWRRTTG